MTTHNEARASVYQRFLDNYTGVASGQITFDNEEFEAQAGGNLPWVRLTVRASTRAQSTLGVAGNRKFRSSATVLVQVYTPFNEGVKQNDLLAKEAADLFEGVSFSGLDFTTATVRELGPDGRWYQSVVEAEFDYDEIK